MCWKGGKRRKVLWWPVRKREKALFKEAGTINVK